jgi:hypothetical protein
MSEQEYKRDLSTITMNAEWLNNYEQELREQIAKEIEPRLFAALGMASMCWSEVPTGVFDSERAEEIGNELLDLIARGQK